VKLVDLKGDLGTKMNFFLPFAMRLFSAEMFITEIDFFEVDLLYSYKLPSLIA